MKNPTFAVLSLVLLTMTSLPALAQPLPRQTLTDRTSNVTQLSRTEFEKKLNSVKVRRRLSAPAPAPQAYWKIYWADRFVLACWVNDKTNKEEFCDLYA